MTDYHRSLPKKTSSHHAHRWSLLIIVVFGVLLIAQVVVSSRLSTHGYEITQVEQEIRELKAQNNQYEEHIASASALMAVKQKAEMLGFTKTAKPIFLSTDAQVAVLR